MKGSSLPIGNNELWIWVTIHSSGGAAKYGHHRFSKNWCTMISFRLEVETPTLRVGSWGLAMPVPDGNGRRPATAIPRSSCAATSTKGRSSEQLLLILATRDNKPLAPLWGASLKPHPTGADVYLHRRWNTPPMHYLTTECTPGRNISPWSKSRKE